MQLQSMNWMKHANNSSRVNITIKILKKKTSLHITIFPLGLTPGTNQGGLSDKEQSPGGINLVIYRHVVRDYYPCAIWYLPLFRIQYITIHQKKKNTKQNHNIYIYLKVL